MIDVREAKTQEVLRGIHRAVEQKLKQDGRVREEMVRDNRILSILVRKPDMAPTECARQMYDRFGVDMTGDQVIRSFDFMVIKNPIERAALLEWANRTARMFAGAVAGNRRDIEAFNTARKDYALKNCGDRRKGLHERALLVALYEMYPELDIDGDREHIRQFGNVYAMFLIYDIADVIAAAYGLPIFRKAKAARPRISIDQAMETIHQLEEALERTNSMLADLQNEFDERLENSRVVELTDFFGQLNSDRYGNILDQLLATRMGVDTLRKNGFALPLEINGLLIMVVKLTQFVRDTHINPVLRLDSEMRVTASDIESYEYEGTPFTDKDEVKRVRVISPGWVFKDKEVMISRPKVREV